MKHTLLDEKFTDSLLGDLNTTILLSFFIGTISIVYFFAWLTRNDYNPRKIMRYYFIFAVPFFLASVFFHLKIVIAIGIYLMGGIVGIFRSNHYFYR